MFKSGLAKKVSIYVGEDHPYHGRSVDAVILDYPLCRGVSGANVTRGIAGFGADHRLRTTRILRLTENLPIKIGFIEAPEKAQVLLSKLRGMVGTGLIEIQDAMVEKPYQQGSRSL